MTRVAVSGLTKSFGAHRVLRHLDLIVPEGQLTAVLGPSGCGKTTLLRLIAGFERADAGSISIGDVVVDGGDGTRFVPPKRRHIGYVSQEGGLFPHLTVSKNIGFGVRRAPNRSQRISDLISVVGLSGLDHRYPHQLSGGQQQRVALARALAITPSLVLLDEPFGSLDAGLRSSVRSDVRRILQETRTTAVLVTHDQDEALSCADTVAVLHDGIVAQQAPPHEVYSRPRDIATARSVGMVNLIEGVGRGSTVSTAFGVHELLPGTPAFAGAPPVIVLVRPEQMRVRSEEVVETGQGGMAGRVSDSRYFGHDVIVTVAPHQLCGTDAILARSVQGEVPPNGEAVRVSVVGPVHAWAGEPMQTSTG
jgi:iron(III) transport system ATP-binding protein